MRKILILLLLTGCATPITTLSNKQGDVVTCGGGKGGSIVGGLIGYTIEESQDKDCVDAYKAKGFGIN